MRALIVDDDAVSRGVLAATLRERDHDVHEYRDAEAAWNAFGTSREVGGGFDLAIVDVRLPGQDGIAFCRQFRRHPAGRQAIILLVTGDERAETLEAGLEAGAHDYIIKPIDQRLLRVRLAIAEQRSLTLATSRYSREALRESEHRFEAFMNNSPAVAFIKDPRGRYLYVNRRYLEVFNVAESAVIGHTDREIFSAAAAATMQSSDDEVLRAGAVQEFQEMVPLGDSPHQWLVYKFPLEDHEGRSTLVAGIAIDITDRVRTEQALKESGERLRLVFESTRDGLWEWNTADGSVQWSDRVYEILGLTRASFSPTLDRVLDLVHPDDRGSLLAAIRSHTAGDGRCQIHLRVRRADGSYAYTESRGQAVFDAGGHTTRMVGSVADVTERVQAEAEHARLEEQMRNAQKLESLGVLAGGIAHDFNNLLVGMLGNASLALLELPPESPARQAIKDIETSAQRAAELTRQMLAYSGRGRFVVEPVDVSLVVQEMSQLLGRVISRKAHFVLRLEPSLPAVVADITQLRQVVMNLITNASDALGGNPGTITLQTRIVEADRAMLASTYLNEELPPGRYVAIEVSDTGAGMDMVTRTRMFEPFFTTKFTGRGLGLAAVLGIVRGHHGAIDVRSEPGAGTTFRILLPATADVHRAAAPPDPQPAWRGTGVVLLVDDEEAVRGLARRVLERSGFQVIEAETGEQAIALCAGDSARPAVVVLDLTMPGLGGEATFRELRRLYPALPVIVSSGYMPEEDGVLSAATFLAKPYRPSELLDVVKRATEGT